jgi:hypothetical protein
MTRKIEDMLFSSDAARSLLTEKRVADRIRGHRWNADTGIYYKDPETSKLREMDVFGVQNLDQPRKSKGIGAPRVNLYVNCECRSLSGWNILFLPHKPKDPYDLRGARSWIGWDLRTIVTNIAEQAKIVDYSRIKRIHDYATARAFVGGERAVIAGAVIDPPPVDVTAWSFRETRGGSRDDENTGDRNQSTPVWNSIRSALDAAHAARLKSKETSLEWIYGLDLKFCGLNNFAHSAAFFLDAELFRSVFFHPFIVLDARLWSADIDGVSEVKSARLYVKDIGHTSSCVDVVNSRFADEYIDAMVKHYRKAAKASVERQWALMEEIGWEPGQARERLLAILRSKAPRRNQRKVGVKGRV